MTIIIYVSYFYELIIIYYVINADFSYVAQMHGLILIYDKFMQFCACKYYAFVS